MHARIKKNVGAHDGMNMDEPTIPWSPWGAPTWYPRPSTAGDASPGSWNTLWKQPGSMQPTIWLILIVAIINE